MDVTQVSATSMKSILTFNCYVNFFGQGVVQMFCCTHVLSSVFCCHIRDDKSGCLRVNLQVSFCAVLKISFSSIFHSFVGEFSPHDRRRREAFNAAGQIQGLTFLQTCIPSHFNFFHIYKTRTFYKML